MQIGNDPVLGRDFYAKSSVDVAKGLLGREIVRVVENQEYRGIITEVAAYQGQTRSSSDILGKAPGAVGISVKFGQRLLDIATDLASIDSCVTLLAAKIGAEHIQGPGKLTKALHIIDKGLDGKKIYETPELYVVGGAQPNVEPLERQIFMLPPNCKGKFYIRP